MRKLKVYTSAIKNLALLVVLGMVCQAMAQDAATRYTKMAPVEQYLMAEPDAEIALARSAAPTRFHAMQRYWFLDVMVLKQRSKGRTVSCASWDAGGLPRRILTSGIRKCVCPCVLMRQLRVPISCAYPESAT
jgi:hypothetical protein